MSRLDEKRVTGHASFTREYTIGYHKCTACKAETPPPPQAVLDELCADGFEEAYVWPQQHWDVPGWTNIHGYGWICDRCSRVVMTVLDARGGITRSHQGTPQPGTQDQVANDLALLEEVTRQALALASEGLLTAFPPPPAPYKEGSYSEGYRFKDPNGSSVYRTLEEYRSGMLRSRIREIRNVLMGRSPKDANEP